MTERIERIAEENRKGSRTARILISCVLSFVSVATFHMRMDILAVRDSFVPAEPVGTLGFAVLAMLGCLALARTDRRLSVHAGVFSCIFGLWEALGYTFETYQGIYGIVATTDQMAKTGLKFMGAAWTAFVIFVLLVRAAEYFTAKSSGAEKYDEPGRSEKFFSGKGIFVLWAVIFACWLPYFIHWYPGIFFSDSYIIMRQVITEEYTRFSPILHLLFVKACMTAGGMTADITAGAGIYVLIQTIAMSGFFAAALRKMIRWRVHGAAVIGTFVCLAFVPVFPIFAITMSKDTIFGGFFLMFVCCLIDYVGTRGNSIRSISGMFIFIGSAVGMMGFRANGLPIFLAAVVLVLFLYPYARKHFAFAGAASWIVFLVITNTAATAIDAYDNDNDGFISSVTVPVQQIARVVSLHGEELSDGNQEFVENVFTDRQGEGAYAPGMVAEAYNPILIDPLYRWLNEDWIAGNKTLFLKGWLSLTKDYPQDAITATLVNGYGYWWPEIRDLGDNFTAGKLETIDTFGLSATGYNAESMQQRSADMNTLIAFFSASPFGIFFRVSLPAIAGLFLVVLTTYRKRKRELALLVPLIVLWTTCLAGPLNAEYRYFFGAFCILPVLAGFFFFKRRETERPISPKRNRMINRTEDI
ncbi:hypothetical protein AGMMS49983_09180 [Clostridia bacterium]|nr:hypothetical protein AGMMS49983_09180 [Clostridia bacterium]